MLVGEEQALKLKEQNSLMHQGIFVWEQQQMIALLKAVGTQENTHVEEEVVVQLKEIYIVVLYHEEHRDLLNIQLQALNQLLQLVDKLQEVLQKEAIKVGLEVSLHKKTKVKMDLLSKEVKEALAMEGVLMLEKHHTDDLSGQLFLVFSILLAYFETKPENIRKNN